VVGSGGATPFFCMERRMLKDDILKIINKAAENSGYSVYESSVYLSGVHTKITVRIDGEKPISHNDCELYSRELGLLLDESGILPDYFLEISSSGINRRISRIEEFIKYKNAPVKVIFAFNGEQRVAKGVLSEINENEIEITEEKSKILICHKDIISANLDY
jgi:ribosome maturation factor RimP